MNENFPHLANAPIVEAILDFRVRLPAGFEVARFKQLHPQFQADYPTVEDRKLVEHKIEQSPGKMPSHSTKDHGVIGYFFRSVDKANIVQFRRDGFTFNRLKPYTSWEQVFPEATRFWRIYVEACRPVEVSRIAVRCINRLMLPGLQVEFGDYLTAPPALPKQMPPFVSGFVSRVVINDPDSNTAAAVVQALEPPVESRYLPVILDIDVFQENVSSLGADELLARFEKLREMKNRAFFGSITDKTLEMLK
ncbi:MAG: TIGR04255 family protein [Verrucomicrobia bacterium]|nr:TIGR04255 family protein [Verrucomicrobiota bacterium]